MLLRDFIVYLDENLDNCEPILNALQSEQVDCKRHRDFFKRGTADAEWLRYVSERSWVVLTKDKRNRYNEIERHALRRHRVREFYFGSGNFTGVEMAQALSRAIPEMMRICRSFDPPVVASITRSGQVTIVYDEHGPTHERRKVEKGRS